MIGIAIGAMLLAGTPQADVEKLLQRKAGLAPECLNRPRSDAFCHPRPVTVSTADAARALQLMIALDRDMVPCVGGEAQACFRQDDAGKALRALGWCHVTAATMTGASDVLWARCSDLPPLQ
jgi:hypothetical protein